MQIGAIAETTGLTIDTLRYYEKIGLIDPPPRRGGKRDYGTDTVRWIAFLKALKATDMPLSDMETYARLRREGTATSAVRRQMLERQREKVKARMAELADCLTTLDYKIANYEAIEATHSQADQKRTKAR